MVDLIESSNHEDHPLLKRRHTVDRRDASEVVISSVVDSSGADETTVLSSSSDSISHIMAGVEPSPVITVMASPSAGEDYPDEMQLDDPIPPERELAMRAATADAHPSPPITVSSDRPDDDPMELSLEDALGEICTNSGSPRDAPLQELTSGPHSVLDPSATDQMENIGPDGSSCMIPLVTPRATQPPIDVTLCERPTFLAVFDLDKTIVGDLETLSDRDNLETNIEWTFWPDGVKRGLTVDDIVPFMERGMLRPGFGRLVDNIVRLGGVIVIYTHSESKWASKVLEAVEIVIGRKFSYRLFPRSDCIDHNPHFRSKKSLLHIFSKLAFRWTRLDNVVMFEDDPNALCRSEATRLLHVPAYDYWEHCPW